MKDEQSDISAFVNYLAIPSTTLICLSTQQLLRLLLVEVCIFSKMHRQIIAEAYCLDNNHINFLINYCRK